MKKDGIHKKIQRKLLLYLDHELSEKERELVHNHLQNCPVCSRMREIYVRLWKEETHREGVAPPPYLWTKLQNRLAGIEKSNPLFFRVKLFIRRYAPSALLVVLLLLSVAVGAFIGSPSGPEYFEAVASIRQTGDQAEEFELDRFDIIPPGSLEEIFYEPE